MHDIVFVIDISKQCRLLLLNFGHSLLLLPFVKKSPGRPQIRSYDDILPDLLRYYLLENDYAVILLVQGKTKNAMLRLRKNKKLFFKGNEKKLANHSSKQKGRIDNDYNMGKNKQTDFPHRYIETGRLFLVTDSDLAAVTTQSKAGSTRLPEMLIGRWLEFIRLIRKKNRHRKLIIISNGEIIKIEVLNNSLTKNIEYEQSIAAYRISSAKLEQAICCYNPSTISQMSMGYLIALINSHNSILDFKDLTNISKLDEYRILGQISRGIDNCLGDGSAKLVFRTLKMVYGIDETKIISNPEVFEQKLSKILGKSSETVRKSIERELRKDIFNAGT